MGSRITLYPILGVIAGFAIIIAMNVISLTAPSHAKYISPSEVRGMAVVHKNLLYTLNFEQQNALVDIFNRTLPISQAEADSLQKDSSDSSEIQKIIVYLFNAPEVEITPIGYVNKIYSTAGVPPIEHKNLIFSAPAWNPDGLMEEASQDQIRAILLKTYDS